LSKKSGRHRYGNPANRQPLMGDLQKRLAGQLNDPRFLGGEIHSFGDGQSESLLDVTNAVHLESMNVCTVDAVRKGLLAEQAIFMVLYGRINKTRDNVQAGFIFGPDGAAALITELLAVADRFGAELLTDITRRLTDLHQEKKVDLHFLKAAIEMVLEDNE
jgi:hypothetical protein